MKVKRLLRVIGVAAAMLGGMWLSLLWLPDEGRAQGGVDLVKVLNRQSNVVRVGEVLSFTVVLTNNAGFTLTRVTLIDEYNQDVLGFLAAIPAASQHNPAAGMITWTNVASPPLPPGRSLTFPLFFTAEHPRDSVVNLARAADITGTGGALSDEMATSLISQTVGGAVPMAKSLWPPGSIPRAGLPVTFTHYITNSGAALITYLPLTDTYNPAFLTFNFAVPSPTITTPPGTLVWTNLASTTYFGPITAGGTIVITTVFTATGGIGGTGNQASVQGARDQYNNQLAAGSALVPITIIDSTPQPTPDQDTGEAEHPTPAATATPLSLNTPTPVPSPTAITATHLPRFLPETGQSGPGPGPGVAAVIGLLALSWYVLKNTAQYPSR